MILDVLSADHHTPAYYLPFPQPRRVNFLVLSIGEFLTKIPDFLLPYALRIGQRFPLASQLASFSFWLPRSLEKKEEDS